MKISPTVSKMCLVCGNIFFRDGRHSSQWNKQKYCSSKCSLTKTGISHQDQSDNPMWKKGVTPWNKGKKGTQPVNSGSFKKGIIPWIKGKKFPERSGKNNPHWKNKTIKVCEFCSKEILLPPWRIRTKRYFCDRKCWALGTRGIGSPVFLGEEATKPLRVRIMELPEHKEWHSVILKRDKYLCVKCGSRKNLEVDHIKRFVHIVKENNIKSTDDARNCKELWDIMNGRTLCRECHRKTDTYGTKGLRKLIS